VACLEAEGQHFETSMKYEKFNCSRKINTEFLADTDFLCNKSVTVPMLRDMIRGTLCEPYVAFL
jgi:hypothetical protein